MPRKKPTSQIYASAFSMPPQNLEREVVHDSQVRYDEQTIRWGEDDALPLRILQAVSASPTTVSCLGKVSDYMQGSGFSDPQLMQMAIDKDGTTLGELHNNICDYMAKLEGFAVRFTFDMEGKITNTYLFPVESCRFVRPSHTKSRIVKQIKYNPYWGTSEWKPDDTETYSLFEKDKAIRYNEIKNADNAKYKGQIYFYGSPKAPYKFYQVPKFWSGANAIYTDASIDSFVKKGLDNGFFQSLLINMIGDPTQPSKNPKYQKKVTGTDGVIRYEWDGKTTVGMEFEAMMASSFSGHDKAFKAMVLWALTEDKSAKIESFPQSQTFSFIDTLEIRTIRKITIATEVPAILANLPQQVSSLGSDGESMSKAVELLQARVREPQLTLEAFYNNILIPNLQETTAARVKIKQLTPFSNQVTVPDFVWATLNEEEKVEWIQMNVPSVTIKRPKQVQQTQQAQPPTPAEQQDTQASDTLKGFNLRDISKLNKIGQRVAKGELSRDQAIALLKGHGLSDEEVKIFLPDEEAVIV